jgi:DNA-directed RNA polymerase subunit RPC12/RpoP
MSFEFNKQPGRLLLITCQKCGQKWEVHMELTRLKTGGRKSPSRVYVFPPTLQNQCGACDSRALTKHVVRLNKDGRIPLVLKQEGAK